MILSLFKKINDKNLEIISTLLISIWVLSPIVMMLLNKFEAGYRITYNIWFTILYFVGDVGIVIGTIFLIRAFKRSFVNFGRTILDSLPFILLIIFGVWCLICSGISAFKFMAFLGHDVTQDCVVTYAAYFGCICMGIIISNNRKSILFASNLFVGVSMVMTVLSLVNNDFSKKFFINGVTCSNSYEYQGVFYNTNHFGYYLTISLLVIAFLFIYTSGWKKKIPYAICLIAETWLLILNDTFGSYLGILVSLIALTLYTIFTKSIIKKDAIILLLIFVVTSIVSLFRTENLLDDFYGIFSNFVTLSSAESTTEEIGEVGTGRVTLWTLGFKVLKQYPVFGVGLQNVDFSSHNLFIQLAVYTGFIGLALYVIVYIVGFVKIIKNRNFVNNAQFASVFVALGYLVSAFFGVTMFYTAPYYYIIFGICMSGAVKLFNINKNLEEKNENEK